MAIDVSRGKSDAVTDQIKMILEKYQAAHPESQIDLYRQNSVSVRIRVIDPDFQRLDRSKRHDRVWQFLDPLPDEVQSEISMLVLLTPDENEKSFANMEFDDPVPSRL